MDVNMKKKLMENRFKINLYRINLSWSVSIKRVNNISGELNKSLGYHHSKILKFKSN